MTEAEKHPGFSFAIMVDQGAIKWNSCSGCSPQAALINQLQYVEQTYFPSPAYMRSQGRPIVTNFNVDLGYAINWSQVTAALSSQPLFWFQNNSGFTHPLSGGSYSWVMPTTTDYGIGYLGSFYNAGFSRPNAETVGATYKGFNDTLASWGSNRIMGQQCGQTWLQTFSEINKLYNSGRQLPTLQLVTWNDYEEATEIETGINNCLTVSASVSGNSLAWSIKGNENTVHHYVAYVSIDGKNYEITEPVQLLDSKRQLYRIRAGSGETKYPKSNVWPGEIQFELRRHNDSRWRHEWRGRIERWWHDRRRRKRLGRHREHASECHHQRGCQSLSHDDCRGDYG